MDGQDAESDGEDGTVTNDQLDLRSQLERRNPELPAN
jgi:hypothetical protein